MTKSLRWGVRYSRAGTGHYHFTAGPRDGDYFGPGAVSGSVRFNLDTGLWIAKVVELGKPTATASATTRSAAVKAVAWPAAAPENPRPPEAAAVTTAPMNMSARKAELLGDADQHRAAAAAHRAAGYEQAKAAADSACRAGARAASDHADGLSVRALSAGDEVAAHEAAAEAHYDRTPYHHRMAAKAHDRIATRLLLEAQGLS